MRHRWHLYRNAEPKRAIGTAAALVASFVVLALTARLLCLDQFHNSAFWPANAALVVALLVLPPRLGWATCAVCFIVNVSVNAATSYHPADKLLSSGLNVVVSVLVAFFTRSLCGAMIDLTRFRRLYVFACICFVSAGCEAFAGDLLQPPSPGLGRFDDWLPWTMCDGISLLIATPALLLAVRSGRAYLACDATLAERVFLLLVTVALDVAAFLRADTPIIAFIYPLLILTSFRAGPPWVLGSVLLTCLIAAAMTSHGYGALIVLAHGNVVLRQIITQGYLVSLFLAAVPANNALGEKNRAMQRLQTLKASIEDDATYDALTSLLNRAAFRRRVATALASGQASAVILIDLDRFKLVNDSMGHLAGDDLLRAFAARLRQVVGEQEGAGEAARLGGDEFAVLLYRNEPGRELAGLCDAIVASGRAPFRLTCGLTHVSVSAGATLTDGAADLDETFRRADVALYAAKAAGRDGYRLFDESLDATAHDDLRLAGDLRAALAGSGGLALHYQLKFGRDGVAHGVEALARWQHPQLGAIPPARFIGLAETSGLILPLGAWVLQEALAFARRWPELSVAVNISPGQMRAPAFLAETLAAIRAASVRPEQIELEITETALLEEAHDPTATIAALRAAGLRIALDDFGTGYSSLRHLRCFRIDRLKIDRSFVLGLSDSAEAAAIIRAVIDLGHAVGLEVTAEGVETEAQRDHLLKAGVDELQGYLLARPVTEAALLKHGISRLAA
jgi:diguanylate cyclase (GGDEF)-like protein